MTKYGKWPGSVFITGGIDPIYNSSEFFYAPVLHKSYWSVALSNITIGNQTIERKKDFRVIVDTGSSMIIVDNSMKDQMKEMLNLTEHTFSCKGKSKLPSIVFNINGNPLPLTPDFYIKKVGEKCKIAIGATKLTGPMKNTVILGDAFLRAYYVHFDYANA